MKNVWSQDEGVVGYTFEWLNYPHDDYLDNKLYCSVEFEDKIDEQEILDILKNDLYESHKNDLSVKEVLFGNYFELGLKEMLSNLESSLSAGDVLVDEVDEAVISSISKINNIILENSRLDPLGKPYHPLESELLDIIEGHKNTLTVGGHKTQLALYRDRLDRKENALGFFKRVYGDYIDAKVIYKDYLRKIDAPLVGGLNALAQKSEIPLDSLLPTKAVRNDRLYDRVNSMDGQVNIYQLGSLKARRNSNH